MKNLRPSKDVGAKDIYFFEEVNRFSVLTVIRALMEAEADTDVTEIRLHMNSGGGTVRDGLALYDYIGLLSKPVIIIVSGSCMSMGVTILMAGTFRYATKNCLFMMHPVSTGGGSSSVTSEECTRDAQATEWMSHRNESLVSKRVGIAIGAYRKLITPIAYMDAAEAYGLGRNGLIDGIIA